MVVGLTLQYTSDAIEVISRGPRFEVSEQLYLMANEETGEQIPDAKK